ncbi:hypothetical protein E4T56_gene5882, partial [Termitomyces sp. T112]
PVDRAAGGKAIRLNNYPARWVDYYERRALGTVDPVHRASHMTSEGFWWSDMPGLIRLNERDEEIMKLGRIQGIGKGFTIPNNLPGEVCGTGPTCRTGRLQRRASAVARAQRPADRLPPGADTAAERLRRTGGARQDQSPDRSKSRHRRRDGGQSYQECLRTVRREQADIAGGLRAVERRDHALETLAAAPSPFSGIHSAQPDMIRDDVMRSMFAARKAVFVDLLQWDVPVLDGRYEIDQFDDRHAHYIILSQEDGNHLGSARLLPTTRPHILGSLYPQLCTQAAPSGTAIFEITRFCLDRRLRA